MDEIEYEIDKKVLQERTERLLQSRELKSKLSSLIYGLDKKTSQLESLCCISILINIAMGITLAFIVF